jgi:hypothetical protein
MTSPEYIKQLEEANDELRQSLDRERFFRQIETKRRNRWYRVVLQDFNLEHISFCYNLDTVFPSIDGGAMVFEVRGMDAVRDVLESRFILRMAHGTVHGLYWRVDLLSVVENSRPGFGDGWRDSILQGWCSFDHQGGWGGSHLNFDFLPWKNIKKYEKFSDFCKYTIDLIKNQSNNTTSNKI